MPSASIQQNWSLPSARNVDRIFPFPIAQEEVPEEDLETQDLMLDERILEAKRRWDAGMELHRLLESRISAHLQAIRG